MEDCDVFAIQAKVLIKKTTLLTLGRDAKFAGSVSRLNYRAAGTFAYTVSHLAEEDMGLLSIKVQSRLACSVRGDLMDQMLDNVIT